MVNKNTISRRQILATSSLSGAAALASWALPANSAQALPRPGSLNGLQPVVLTISGPGVQGNRGNVDAVHDRMLASHGYQFDSAWACGLDALTSLTEQRLQTAIEYDDKTHDLRGPLLETVLQAAGLDIATAISKGYWLTLQAIDGYRAQMPLAQALRWQFVLVTHADGQPLSTGGLGPLWAMYDAKVIPELANTTPKERYEKAPWGLYYIGITEGKPQA